MDIFEDSYYKLNRFFLSMVGLWPFLDKKRKFVLRIIAKMSLACLLIPQISMIASNVTMETVTNVCMFFLPSVAIAEGYYTMYVNNEKVKMILEHIKYDWSIFAVGRERGIMQEHAEESKMFTVILAAIHYFSMYFLIFFSMTPAILDLVAPLNETRPRELPIPAVFFFDHEKYFFYMILIAFFVTTVVGAISMAFYPLILICMKHICGLFQIAGYLFENIINEENEGHLNDAEQLYARVVHSVKCHKRAINFANLVNSYYEWNLFFQFVLTFVMLAIEIFIILTLDTTEQNFDEIVTYVFYVFAVMIFVFFTGHIGQLVIDYSADVFNKAYATPWYLLPIKTRKLFYLVMMRSIKPCYISVGCIQFLSYELLMSTLQKSVSYAMVIKSFK
ncbi:odorant receptor 22c-like [Vespula pensylvanica]|uniref:odorant receptor 22c-like n=1 Tax=Vespula pensylvanica TaxID=30213 RepID=UPI001CBA592F|nr:odorant receptor 22c-like [Vespula pensylvanica]